MSFAGFLGNENIKDRLSGAIQAGKLSHSYLICGPQGSGKRTLGRFLAAAMQCKSDGVKPCLTCPQCRKVMEDKHPDVIFVDDPERKTVRVDLARWAKADLYIRPNEGNRKIYVFPRAQDMNDAAQNALLKVLEEPPAYGAFLLLAQSPEMLLPTIRSRCVELKLSPVPRPDAEQFLISHAPGSDARAVSDAYERSGGFLGPALQILRSEDKPDARAVGIARAFAAGDRLALTEILFKMEKIRRDQLVPILSQLQTVIAQALSAKAGRPVGGAAEELSAGMTAARLLKAYEDVRTALDAANGNVGVGHICGFLAIRLR